MAILGLPILGDPRKNNPAGIRAWNLGNPSGTVSATLASTPPPVPTPGAPPPAGSPAGVLGSMATAPAAPAATGGGGGILGMTGGQAALAAMSGVASFLGGYQRNPGLLQQSRYMQQALYADIEQQRNAAIQAQIAADTQAIMGTIDPADPQSFERAGMEFMRRGMKDMGEAMFRRRDTMEDDARADVQQAFNIEKGIRQLASKELAPQEIALTNARAAQAVVTASGGVNNMSREDDEALMTFWAKVLRPREALMSDDRAVMAASGLSGTFQQYLSFLTDNGKLTPTQRNNIIRQINTISLVHEEDYRRKGGDIENFARRFGSTAGATTKAAKPQKGFDPLQGEAALKEPTVSGTLENIGAKLYEKATTPSPKQKEFSDWFNNLLGLPSP